MILTTERQSHTRIPDARRKPVPRRRVLRPHLTLPRHPRYLGSLVISFATSAATCSGAPPHPLRAYAQRTHRRSRML